MSTENNLTFESDQFKYKSRVILGQSEVPKMTKFLIGKGLVKNEKQATAMLLATTVLFLLASIYVFTVFVFDVQLFNKKPTPSSTRTPEQIQERKEMIEKMKEQRQQRPVDTTNTQNPQ